MPAVHTDILKGRRDELDLPNKELAELVLISPAYLDNVLCGADHPSMRLVHRFARVLDVPVEEILKSGDRTPQGDPSEPPLQPRNEPAAPPRRQDTEQDRKAPKRTKAVAS